ANLRPVAHLVSHAAGLTAHAEGAGLAGVLAPHRLPELPPANSVGHAQRVADRRPTAAARHAFHCRPQIVANPWRLTRSTDVDCIGQSSRCPTRIISFVRSSSCPIAGISNDK